MKKTIFIRFFILWACMVAAPGGTAAAQSLRAEAVAEKSAVFAGESIAFQIRVFGSEKPEQPDLSDIQGCRFEFQGGQQNSSSSITIINGKMTKNVQTGYVFSYRLTPLAPGRLVIPQITIQADGKQTKTRPVVMTVQKPMETEDFKLRVELSRRNSYVGEPITLTFTWYMAKDVRSLRVQMPFLDSDSFHFADPDINTKDGGQYYRIPLGEEESIGKMGKGSLAGRGYSTLTMQKVVIPRKPGVYKIDPATAVAEVLAGYRQRKNPFGNDFFSEFFKDDLFQGRSSVYKKVVVPSNSLHLKVSDLPEEGRPPNFAGHVGTYRIAAAASPIEAHVGDPITLKVIVSGPDYLDYVELPSLQGQARLAADFKIPKERAVGELTDQGKVFTQTIRAKQAGVKQIPAIELPYFDTRAGAYRVARSEPIPVTIKKAKVITAQDAEGLLTPLVPNGSQVESWGAGIAYNYEDADVLQPKRTGLAQWVQSPRWLLIIGLPPLVYCLLFGGRLVRNRRQADPYGRQARKAFSRLKEEVKQAQESDESSEIAGRLLEAVRQYLGAKLRMPAGALTFADVKEKLAERGLDAGTLDQLKAFFDQCEAERYTGGLGQVQTEKLAVLAVEIGEALEKRI